MAGGEAGVAGPYLLQILFVTRKGPPGTQGTGVPIVNGAQTLWINPRGQCDGVGSWAFAGVTGHEGGAPISGMCFL